CCGLKARRDAKVGLRNFEEWCVMPRASEPTENLVRFWREVATHLHQGHDLPVFRERRVEGGECVRDPPPLLDRRLRGIAALNRVPHHGPDDAESLQRKPQCFWMNTAAAP